MQAKVQNMEKFLKFDPSKLGDFDSDQSECRNSECAMSLGSYAHLGIRYKKNIELKATMHKALSADRSDLLECGPVKERR